MRELISRFLREEGYLDRDAGDRRWITRDERAAGRDWGLRLAAIFITAMQLVEVYLLAKGHS